MSQLYTEERKKRLGSIFQKVGSISPPLPSHSSPQLPSLIEAQNDAGVE